MEITREDIIILRQLFARTLAYAAEEKWAREFLARMERAVMADEQEKRAEPKADD